jgi:hypothetical protein
LRKIPKFKNCWMVMDYSYWLNILNRYRIHKYNITTRLVTNSLYILLHK